MWKKLRDDEVFCIACGNRGIRENESSAIKENEFKIENKIAESSYIREKRVRRPISKGLSKIAIKIALIMIAVSIVVECNYHIKEINIREDYYNPLRKFGEEKDWNA